MCVYCEREGVAAPEFSAEYAREENLENSTAQHGWPTTAHTARSFFRLSLLTRGCSNLDGGVINVGVYLLGFF